MIGHQRELPTVEVGMELLDSDDQRKSFLLYLQHSLAEATGHSFPSGKHAPNLDGQGQVVMG